MLGPGEQGHRPLQWPRVSLLTQGTLQIRIPFVRQRSDLTLEQTSLTLKRNTSYVLRESLSTDNPGASQLEEPAKKPCSSAVAAVTYLLLKKRIKGRTLTS